MFGLYLLSIIFRNMVTKMINQSFIVFLLLYLVIGACFAFLLRDSAATASDYLFVIFGWPIACLIVIAVVCSCVAIMIISCFLFIFSEKRDKNNKKH